MSEKSIKIKIESEHDYGSILCNIVDKVPAKRIMRDLMISLNCGAQYGAVSDTNEAINVSKILAYIGHNWEKVLKDANKFADNFERKKK